MNQYVKKVVPIYDYKLRITFANGEVRIFDVKPLLDKGVFRELKDESLFKSAHVWHGTVRWSGGQDICPDTLYEESMAVSKDERMMVRQKKTKYTSKKVKAKSRPIEK